MIIKRIEAGLSEPFDPDEELPPDLRRHQEEFENLDEDGQHKHVFACFGIACYCAQCFETEVKIVLLLDARARGKVCTQEGIEALDVSFSKKTLGQLVRVLKEHIYLDENGLGLIKRALQARNSLSHGYFEKHIWEFARTSTRRTLVQKLLRQVRLLMWADGICQVVRKVFLPTLGISGEEIESEYNHLLAENTEKE